MTFRSLDPLAPLTPDSVPFWEAARRHTLALPRCLDCKRLIAYPRSFCPHCQSDRVRWEDHSGRGTVYSFGIVHQTGSAAWRDKVPYVVGVVELEPGARLTTRFVECDAAALRIGMPVEVTFVERSDAIVVPAFRPARSSS